MISRTLKFCIVIVGMLCYAANSAAIDHILFEHLETKVGLTLVNDIYRDDNDFLWIANEGFGLMRYDSNDIVSYVHDESDSTSISGDHLKKIYEDSKGNFWVGTFNGLNLLDRETGTFKRYLKLDGIPNSPSVQFINDIVEDHDGRLWIATGSGLYEYIYDQDSVVLHPNAKYPKLYSNFTSLSVDSKGLLWLVGTDAGVFSYDANDTNFSFYGMNAKDDGVYSTKKILIDSDGEFWITMSMRGVARFNVADHTFSYIGISCYGPGLNTNAVRSIMEYEKGIICVGTDQGGLNIFHKQNQWFTYINSIKMNAGDLSSNGIYSMHLDKEGIFWVGTSRGGINFFNPKKHKFNTVTRIPNSGGVFPKEKYLSHNIVGAFLESSDGKIWIGTDGGGINVLDRKTSDIVQYTRENSDLSSNTIRDLSEDSEGNIWVATWGDKVNKFIKKTKSFEQLDLLADIELPLIRNLLWSVKVDHKDRIWFNFLKGHVLLLDKNGKEIYRMIVDPNNTHYYNKTVFIDGGSDIFVNTTGGIYRFNEEKIDLELFIEKDEVFSFSKDSQGNYWLGTLEDGAFCYNEKGEQLVHYNTQNGLSGNCVYSIECTSNNIVWFATNSGLSQCFLETHSILNYKKSDGLQGNQYFMQSSLKTKDELLFFGGTEGLDYFYSKDIMPNDVSAKATITNVIVKAKGTESAAVANFNSIQAHNKEIYLSWDENMLTFKFNAISYTYPEKTQYKYKLIGFDQETDYTLSNINSATYTNLNPGEYIFHVYSCNNDGVWNTEGDKVSFVIKAPFWEKTWFYVLVVLLSFFALYLLFRWRASYLWKEKERLRLRVEERTTVIASQKNELLKQKDKLYTQKEELKLHRDHLENLVEDRTKKLEKSKQKAEESDRLKSYFLANMSHELRTPMNAVIGFSSLLDDDDLNNTDRKEYVKTIVDNSNSLLYLIEDILDFSTIEANQLKVNAQPFSIVEVINNVFLTHQVNLDNESIDLRKNISLIPSDMQLNTDEYRTRQILVNLVSNAIKFTEEGFVEVGVKPNKESIELYVQDSGKGLSKADMDVVFNQFVKLDRDQLSAKRGIGLGLSISKRLANLLGGELSVESTVGVGSRFVFTLPNSVIVK